MLHKLKARMLHKLNRKNGKRDMVVARGDVIVPWDIYLKMGLKWRWLKIGNCIGLLLEGSAETSLMNEADPSQRSESCWRRYDRSFSFIA